MTETTKCKKPVETFSRCCGFYRPVQQWNVGKREEFKERREFIINGMGSE